ncbi:MAG: hypothetical protein GX159_09685 [Flavobacteriaceae bacterium]|jgi:hypothetical protein|nr:hypothetical protein [Flavobacteriaceae bacterium]
MKATKTNVSPEVEILMRNKRSTVLTIATRTGIKKPDTWDEFNNWMKTKSVHKKDLHRYSSDELDDLIRQFRALESNFKKSAEKVGTKAWYQKTGLPQASFN